MKAIVFFLFVALVAAKPSPKAEPEPKNEEGRPIVGGPEEKDKQEERLGVFAHPDRRFNHGLVFPQTNLVNQNEFFSPGNFIRPNFPQRGPSFLPVGRTSGQAVLTASNPIVVNDNTIPRHLSSTSVNNPRLNSFHQQQFVVVPYTLADGTVGYAPVSSTGANVDPRFTYFINNNGALQYNPNSFGINANTRGLNPNTFGVNPNTFGLTNPNTFGLANPNTFGLANPNTFGLANPNTFGLANPTGFGFNQINPLFLNTNQINPNQFTNFNPSFTGTQPITFPDNRFNVNGRPSSFVTPFNTSDNRRRDRNRFNSGGISGGTRTRNQFN